MAMAKAAGWVMSQGQGKKVPVSQKLSVDQSVDDGGVARVTEWWGNVQIPTQPSNTLLLLLTIYRECAGVVQSQGW